MRIDVDAKRSRGAGMSRDAGMSNVVAIGTRDAEETAAEIMVRGAKAVAMGLARANGVSIVPSSGKGIGVPHATRHGAPMRPYSRLFASR